MAQLHDDAAVFEELLRQHAPDVEFRHRGHRSGELLNVFWQAIVVLANVGGAAAFCAACLSYLRQKPQYAMEIAYVDKNGAPRGAVYASGTIAELESLLTLQPPDWKEGIQVTIRRPGQ